MNYFMDLLIFFYNVLLLNMLWLILKKIGFFLLVGNYFFGVFGWFGYFCLVISKIIVINSGKFIVYNLVMNIMFIFF